MQGDDRRQAILDALAAEVPFDGWTQKSLRQALVRLGEHPDDAPLVFPNGTAEMIEGFCALADQRMLDASAAADLQGLRVPARVRAVIAIRLQQSRANKEAIRRALAWLALPMHAGLAVRLTAATADAIWHAAGDKAADFSWYSKRAILAGVYGATLLYWLRDAAEDDQASLAFLDRRLQGVAGIGALRRRAAAAPAKLRQRVRGFRRGAGAPDRTDA